MKGSRGVIEQIAALSQSEDCQMKMHWVRILIAGLAAEILLLLIFISFVQRYGRGTVSEIIVIGGSFAFTLLGALWVARKIELRFILHGILVGVVAVIVYVLMSLPDALSGEYPGNYWVAAVQGHTPKLLGGLVGGYIAGRRRTKAV